MLFAAAVITCPAMVVTSGVADSVPNGVVLDAMTRFPAASNDIGVPATEMAGSPGWMVVPAIVRAVGFAMRGWLAIVVVRVGGVDARGMVLASRIRELAVLREIRVPPTVAAGSPGWMSVAPIVRAAGFAVIIWLAIVVVRGSERDMVLESRIREPAVSRMILVPSSVVAGSPGFIVVPAIAMAVG